MAQNLAMEHTVAAAIEAVLRDAEIPAFTMADVGTTRQYPSVLVEVSDMEEAIASSQGDAGVFRAMAYLHIDTYFPDDPNGSALASLVSLARGRVLIGLRAQVAAECPEYTFFAVKPGKAYQADELNLRRITQEVEIVFSPTAQNDEENNNANG